MARTYDLVAIAAGTAGLSAVQAAAAMGKQPLLVSDGPIGGECTWNGCVPSKALIEAARLRHSAARADAFGIRLGDVTVDFAGVMRRVEAVVESIAQGESW